MSIQKNYLYNTLLQITNILYPLITFPYVSRVIGPEGIGQVAFILSLTQYFVLIAALGIPAYGVREIARLKGNPLGQEKLFNELFTINFIQSLIVGVIYLIVVLSLTTFNSELPYFLYGLVFVVLGFTNIDWYFSGREEFKLITVRNLIVKLASIAFLFVFVRERSDFNWYFAITFVALLLNNLVNILFLKGKLNFRFTLHYRSHLRPLIMLFATIFITGIYILLDSVILGFLTNNTEVGYYNASMRLYKAALPIVTSLGVVMLPRMSQALEANNKQGYQQMIDQSVNFHFLISMPIALIVFLFAKQLLLLFAGEEFYPAIVSTQYLAPLIVVVGYANILMLQILNTLRLEKMMVLAVIAGALVSVVLNFVLIPQYLHLGAAKATFVTEIFISLILTFMVLKYTEFKLQFGIFFRSCLSLLPMIAGYRFLQAAFLNNWWNILLFAGTGVFVYFMMMLFVFKNEILRKIYNRFLLR